VGDATGRTGSTKLRARLARALLLGVTLAISLFTTTGTAAASGPLIVGNNASAGGGPIQTFDFSTGAVVNSFVPDGATNNNGRGVAVVGNEVFYTELSSGSGATDSIHVAPFNDGAGGSDIRTIPNPAPSTGVQDLDYANGALYALTGYSAGSLQVWKLDPTSGAVLAGPIAISSDPTADGFTILPNGDFLINTGDMSCTYDEYNRTTGAATGSSVTVPGASSCTGVATDGVSLYFETDFSGFTQTDLSGNLVSNRSVPSNEVEDISLVSTAPPPLPTVTSVTPAQGPWSGGTTVAVTGTNFTAGDELCFFTPPPLPSLEGCSSTNTIVSSTQLSAVTPGLSSASSAGALYLGIRYQSPNNLGLQTYISAVTYTFTGGAGGCGNTASGIPGVHRYCVELKAWIPQKEVVDPEAPIDWLPWEPLIEPVCENGFLYTIRSISAFRYRYNGNNHSPFDGGFKVDMPLEFDWDGHTISNFHVAPIASVQGVNVGHVGTTHHLIDQSWPFGSAHCEEVKTADDTVGSSNTRSSGNSFEAEYSIGIPLIAASVWFPIFDHVSGVVEPNGALRMTITHSEFPSHGLRVSIDGTAEQTRIYNDASCLSQGEVIGPGGAVNLTEGLVSRTDDTFVIPPSPQPSAATPTLLCRHAAPIITGPFLPLGHSSSASAAAASTVEVVTLGAHGKPGPALSVAAAQSAGLIQLLPDGTGRTLIVSFPSRPVELRVRGRGLAFRVGKVQRGGTVRNAYYGPISGSVTIDTASPLVTVTSAGRTLRARARPPGAPVMSVSQTRRGTRRTLHFTVHARASLLAIHVSMNGSERILRGMTLSVHVPAHGKVVVSYYATDVFGDIGKVKSLSLRG
jgi:IPT/TIG domain